MNHVNQNHRDLSVAGRAGRAPTANPFLLILVVYAVINTCALVLIFVNDSLVVEQNPTAIGVSDAIWAFSGLSLTLLFLFLGYRSSLVFKKSSKEIEFGTLSGILLIALQLSYLLYNTYFGFNIAGRVNPGSSELRYLFYFLQSDFIFIVISLGLSSKRLFAINSAVYMLSTLSRGWVGGILILLVIVFCRNYPVRLSYKNVAKISIGLLLLILILPLIMEARWIIRGGGDLGHVTSNIAAKGYLNSIVKTLDFSINRLQHLGHVAVLVENSEKINADYNAGKFTPYWLDGLPQQFIMELAGRDHYTLNRYMNSALFGNENPAANSNPGLGGWLFVLRYEAPFLLLYLTLITVPAYLFILRYAGTRYLLLLACFSLVYLWHGWLGAYISMLFYMLLFIFLKRLSFGR